MMLLIMVSIASLLCEALFMPYTPVISSITPNTGSYAGGTEIRIQGGGFLSSNGVDGTFVSDFIS
jgi:hypothetical protein